MQPAAGNSGAESNASVRRRDIPPSSPPAPAAGRSPARLAGLGGNKPTPGPGTPRPARISAAILPLVGLIAVLVGCFVAWSHANATFGWFAYAPLSNEVFTGNGIAFVSQGTQIGLAVAVTGLLVLAFWAGYRIGRNAKPTN